MPSDPGLQAERTALAWQRTGVAGSALAGATTVAAAHRVAPWVLVVVAALAVLCAGAAALVTIRGGASVWTRLLAVAAIPVLLLPAGALIALT